MSAQVVRGEGRRESVNQDSARSLLSKKLAGLSEAECGEVLEYIEVMRSLRREAADCLLFGDGFARRVSAVCERAAPAATA